jgi:glutamyl-tRNA synthetase
MPASQSRVRFAPSPTGYLHVGGVRTALFNWLYARKVGGNFLLRIEDTDRERSSDQHTKVIIEGMTWLGLEWDEDVVFQGAGVERHRALAADLVANGHAYEREGATWLAMPPDEIGWSDIVHGPISFRGSEVKDWVILRSDRTPTYNFVVVADDLEMRISHVLRGDDHISNTPKQLAVYNALGVAPPIFGHVPNVLGPDGKKLSKRHGATAVGEYRAMGFLPAAMRNFLALLGWNPGDDRELYFDTQELINAFSLESLQAKSALFDVKKLEWMNGQHISQMAAADLLELIESDLTKKYGIAASRLADVATERVIDAVKPRARLTTSLAHQVAVRLDGRFIERDEKASKLIATEGAAFRDALAAARQRLTELADARWEAGTIESELRALADALGVGVGKVMQPIRVALTGGTVSEPVNELLVVVGKTESLDRMARAEQWPGE